MNFSLFSKSKRMNGINFLLLRFCFYSKYGRDGMPKDPLTCDCWWQVPALWSQMPASRKLSSCKPWDHWKRQPLHPEV